MSVIIGHLYIDLILIFSQEKKNIDYKIYILKPLIHHDNSQITVGKEWERIDTQKNKQVKNT